MLQLRLARRVSSGVNAIAVDCIQLLVPAGIAQ